MKRNVLNGRGFGKKRSGNGTKKRNWKENENVREKGNESDVDEVEARAGQEGGGQGHEAKVVTGAEIETGTEKDEIEVEKGKHLTLIFL